MNGPPPFLGSGIAGSERPTWREKTQFAVAAGLILIGSIGLGVTGTASDAASADRFLVYGGLLGAGYVFGWGIGGRWPYAVLVVAVVARIGLLPFAASEDVNRRIWEAEALASGVNPVEVAPAEVSSERLRDRNWEKIADKDRRSTQSPGSFALFRAMNAVGVGPFGVKFFGLLADLIVCILLAVTFGRSRVTLYAWNPLAIFYSAGAGQFMIFTLLPIMGAFALWIRYIERKGALSLLGARDLGSGVGQIVGVAAFLAGVAASLKLVWAPFLVWMVWLVIRKAGLKSGIAVLIAGLVPLAATRVWAFFALNMKPIESVMTGFFVDRSGMSLFAQDGGFSSQWLTQLPLFLLVGIGLATAFWIFTNDTLERFGLLFVSLFLLLAPMAQPWHVLMLAPLSTEGGRHLFRAATLGALVYFVSFRELAASGEWELQTWQLVAIWLPFVVAAIWYGVAHSGREDGFYVHSH